MSDTRDIEIPLRADYSHEITFVDSQSVPFDVSSWTFTAAARRLDAPQERLVTFAINASSASSGRIIVSLSSASTSTLTGERAIGWDVRYTVGTTVGYLWPGSKVTLLPTMTYD